MLRDAPGSVVNVALCATERIRKRREEARAVVDEVRRQRSCARAKGGSEVGGMR